MESQIDKMSLVFLNIKMFNAFSKSKLNLLNIFYVNIDTERLCFINQMKNI